MSEGKIIVGLDIGTTKIACIVGRKGAKGKIEILGYGKAPSTGVSRGIVTNIDETVNAIRAAVDEASAQSNVDIKSVNVGIAGQHIKSLQHRGVLMRDNRDVEITDEELEKLRLDTFKINMTPGEEIIDVIPQEYFVDGELERHVGQQVGGQLPRHHRAEGCRHEHREVHPKGRPGDGPYDPRAYRLRGSRP